jgi:hypothetical protein
VQQSFDYLQNLAVNPFYPFQCLLECREDYHPEWLCPFYILQSEDRETSGNDKSMRDGKQTYFLHNVKWLEIEASLKTTHVDILCKDNDN